MRAGGHAAAFGRSVLIFDMDGTLLDSMDAWKENIRLVALNFGVSLPDNFYQLYKTMVSWEVAEHLVSHYHARGTSQKIFDALTKGIEGYYASSISVKPFARELLEDYQSQGLTLALLTGTERSLIDLVLNRLGLADYFALTRSCREAGGPKSSPVPFSHMLSALNARSDDAVLFEDGLHSVETARRCGIFTVGVYDETWSDVEPQMQAACDRYVRSLGELFSGEALL